MSKKLNSLLVSEYININDTHKQGHIDLCASVQRKTEEFSLSVSLLHSYACNDFSAEGNGKAGLSNRGYLQLHSSCP